MNSAFTGPYVQYATQILVAALNAGNLKANADTQATLIASAFKTILEGLESADQPKSNAS